MNTTWHRAHPMPKKPSAAQRLTWHLQHAKACDCRTLTTAALRNLRALAREEQSRGRRRLVRSARDQGCRAAPHGAKPPTE
jgi:hypothetical protein